MFHTFAVSHPLIAVLVVSFPYSLVVGFAVVAIRKMAKGEWKPKYDVDLGRFFRRTVPASIAGAVPADPSKAITLEMSNPVRYVQGTLRYRKVNPGRRRIYIKPVTVFVRAQ